MTPYSPYLLVALGGCPLPLLLSWAAAHSVFAAPLGSLPCGLCVCWVWCLFLSRRVFWTLGLVDFSVSRGGCLCWSPLTLPGLGASCAMHSPASSSSTSGEPFSQPLRPRTQSFLCSCMTLVELHETLHLHFIDATLAVCLQCSSIGLSCLLFCLHRWPVLIQ